jgi:hypothetical protein
MKFTNSRRPNPISFVFLQIELSMPANLAKPAMGQTVRPTLLPTWRAGKDQNP